VDRKADAAGRAGESRLVGEADVGEGDADRDEFGMLDDDQIRDSGSRGQDHPDELGRCSHDAARRFSRPFSAS